MCTYTFYKLINTFYQVNITTSLKRQCKRINFTATSEYDDAKELGRKKKNVEV